MSVIPKMYRYLTERTYHDTNQRNRGAGQFGCAEVIRPGGHAGQKRPRQKAVARCVGNR
jgi:hypothetical protein